MAKRIVSWACPIGIHEPRHGSPTPPDNATIRYCLECSHDNGTLTERVCETDVVGHSLANDQMFIAGVDVLTRLGELINLKCWRGHFEEHGEPESEINVSAKKDTVCGRAYKRQNRIVLNLSAKANRGQIEVAMIHELSHIVAPEGSQHNAVWKAIYAAAMMEAWGVRSKANSIDRRDADYRDKILTCLQASP